MTRSAPGTSELQHAADRAPRHSVERQVSEQAGHIPLMLGIRQLRMAAQQATEPEQHPTNEGTDDEPHYDSGRPSRDKRGYPLLRIPVNALILSTVRIEHGDDVAAANAHDRGTCEETPTPAPEAQ